MSRDALIVGINSYKNLPSLGAPAHDAEDIARCFESFGECRVVRLPEAIQEQKPIVSQQAFVTTKMLEDALIRLFKPTGKNIPQTAIFYFSGHGLQRNAGIQEGFLATSDTNPEAGNHGLSLYWLRRLLRESPVRQRVIILDCCNSGEFFNILEADPGPQSGTDRLFMAASREYEEAYESLTGTHSVFTQALLSGLNPYKVKGSIVNGHHLIDTVNEQLKGELQQPLFESSGTEIILTRAGNKICQPTSTHGSALDRLKQLRYKYCPFQGLAPYEATQGSFFFGREALTQDLVQLAQTSRLSVLAGPSGIGKTSILQAGLIHTLNQQKQQEPERRWDIRYVSLSHNPLMQLAEAFVDPTVSGLQRAEQIRTAESFFHNRAEGMTELVQATLKHQDGPANGEPGILLVIDHFEALFAPGVDESSLDQRQAVLDCLTAVVNKHHVPIHIVVGMRSQHLQDLEAYPDFYRLAAKHCLMVPNMSYDQLKAAIVGPLDKVGLQYDANLIYTLLLDVVGSPGELSLLQLALTTLWQHRVQEPSGQLPPHLTLETYVKLGSLRQMLRQHATQMFEILTVEEKPIAQRILLSLCEFGESSTPSRRQVELEELITLGVTPEQVTATMNKLVAARLVVVHADYGMSAPAEVNVHQSVPAWSSKPSNDSQVGILSQLFQQQSSLTICSGKTTPYFEICHDSLLRNWPLYETWLQDYRPLMKLQRSIESAAIEWQQQQRPNHPDYFLSQTRLSEAVVFRAKHSQHLSTLAHQYLEVCSHHARAVKRKRYFMRMLIPLSMMTGMLAAYGHSSLTNGVQVNGQGPDRMTHAVDETIPHYEKSDVEMVKSSEPLGSTPSFTNASRSTDRHPTTFQSGKPNGGDGGAATTAASAELGNGSSRPLSVPLMRAMEQSTVGPEAWQQYLQALPPVPNPNLGVAASQQSELNPLEMLPQPVAQWRDPFDPQVMIQVWCTRNQVQPECFASPVPLRPAADNSAANL